MRALLCAALGFWRRAERNFSVDALNRTMKAIKSWRADRKIGDY
jgi:hypothetical protein